MDFHEFEIACIFMTLRLRAFKYFPFFFASVTSNQGLFAAAGKAARGERFFSTFPLSSGDLGFKSLRDHKCNKYTQSFFRIVTLDPKLFWL